MNARLPRHLAALMDPRAYPHAVCEVGLIETHLAWILLAGEHAYKIKRPVRYPFVDQRSPERRASLCSEELRLNRRFAPQLYLEVSRIVDSAGQARIAAASDPVGKVIEHAVHMKRFDRSQQLDRLLEAGGIGPQELEAFGRRIAQIHTGLPAASQAQPWGRPESVRRAMSENLAECEDAMRSGLRMERPLAALAAGMMRGLEASSALMTHRIAHGAIRECHGDLHSRNVVRQDGELIPFDCLEFEPAFRWIDVAEEAAFLTVDLKAQGYAAHAHAFLSGWLEHGGDYVACRLLGLYEAHHAVVRAKVVALSASTAGTEPSTIRAQVDRYLQAAQDAIVPRQPILILTGGLSGSGKSTLARQLAQALSAVHLRSDVERKRLAGLASNAASASAIGAGLYTADASEQVYERLALCAQDALAGGFTAIVDATLIRRAERLRFRQLADRIGARLLFIHCHAPLYVLRDRVALRALRRDDPSEADLGVLEWQLGRAEPVIPDEQLEVLEMDTGGVCLSPSFAHLLERCGYPAQ